MITNIVIVSIFNYLISILGGIITLEDLGNYTALVKKPVHVTLSNGDYTLYGPPPPSSAAVMFYILNIMNGESITLCSLSLTPMDQITEEKTLHVDYQSFLSHDQYIINN